MSSKAESGEDFHPALFIQLEGDILLFLLNLSCYPAVFSDNTVLLDPFLSTSWLVGSFLVIQRASSIGD